MLAEREMRAECRTPSTTSVLHMTVRGISAQKRALYLSSAGKKSRTGRLTRATGVSCRRQCPTGVSVALFASV